MVQELCVTQLQSQIQVLPNVHGSESLVQGSLLFMSNYRVVQVIKIDMLEQIQFQVYLYAVDIHNKQLWKGITET